MVYQISDAILSDEGVQGLMLDKREHFDMLLIDAGYLDAVHGLAEYFNATLVGVSCFHFNWFTDVLAGNPAPSIYDPISPIGYSLANSLLNRFYNWMYITEEKLLERLVFRPPQLRVFKKYFKYPPEKMVEFRSRFAIILVNNHFSMGRVRANVPNIIEVGGIHLSEPAEPCGKELQQFLDEADDGVIYFSMGTEILVKYLPETMQQALLQTFANLKQRVVWKSEFTTMPNKPENVYLMSVTPQREILEHPNLRLFITHGGLSSLIEAIYSGVPMLGIPMFYDQFGNMHRLKMAGIAEVLDFGSLTTDSLNNSILELIGDPKYSARAKEMSRSFRDRPMSPLDTAIWWTEYALRNPDVSHMRLNKEEIPFLQYYLLDSCLPMGLRFGFITGSLILLGFKLYKKYRDRYCQETKRVFRHITTLEIK
ncbi:hypothetical protein KR009_009267 [Drosophila setifemur]|nr:hypothetical protein KR009_009267 [Drosophila setifemur]